MEKLIGKNTWLGFGASLCILLLGIAGGAVCLDKGVISASAEDNYLLAVCGLSSTIGGFLAAKGKHRHLIRAMIVAAMVYLFLWLVTLTADGVAKFDRHAICVLIAMSLGGVLGSFLVPRKERNHKPKKGRRSVYKTGKRPVT